MRSSATIALFGIVLGVGAAAAQPSSQGVGAAARAVRSEARARGVPGVAFSIALRGRVRTMSVGSADLGTRARMRASTPLYAGSLSKLFTALVVSSLADAGVLSLDDPVSAHLPELRLAGDARDQITMAMLLTHTSGLHREGGDYWFTGTFPDEAALLDSLADVAPRTPPGSAVSYSNVGYALAGLIAARAAGKPYPVLLAETLSALGLNHTAATRPSGRLANGYSPPRRVLPSAERPFAGLAGIDAASGRRVRMYHEAQAMTPAFGVHTTAADLGRLVHLVLGAGVEADPLSTATRQRLTSVQYPTGAADGWAHGLRVGHRRGRRELHHDGWFAAHRSHILMAPDAEAGVAIMTNADDAQPRLIARAALDALLPSVAR